jgi:hypothetical protein
VKAYRSHPRRAAPVKPSRRWEDDPIAVAARAKAHDALDRIDSSTYGNRDVAAYRDLGEAMIELCPLPWPVLPNGGQR